MTGPSDERALALWLSARRDDELAAVLARRGVAPTSPWRDFYDAAAALLEPSAVDRALQGAFRGAFEAISDPQAADDRARIWLRERALADEAGIPYPVIAERAAASRPVAAVTAARPAEALPVATDQGALAAAAERAFTAVAALTDVLIALRQGPLGRVGSGAITAAERRRLVDEGAVADGAELDDVVAGAAAAGLVDAGPRQWSLAPTGQDWLDSATPVRWEIVARGLIDTLPAGLLTPHGAVTTPSAWPDAYPLQAEWPDRARLLRRRLERWAILVDDEHLAPWSPTVAGDGDADRDHDAGVTEGTTADGPADRIAQLLPVEIDRVYLQADLSAIAPGPLLPALDMRLRTMARRESRAQASTYRFSAETLEAAVAGGESAESMRGFLAELSLTGIPQPLEYLIDRAGATDRVLRVRTDSESGRTLVEADDPDVLATVAVDHTVRAIGLVDDGPALTTAVGRDAVYWTLADAHYRVVALDPGGERETVRRTPGREDAPRSDRERYRDLIDRLRASAPDDPDAAWLERELDQAVRGRRLLEISVALPDGSTRELTIEATGMGGGRLRGLDRAADVERTFPVASIKSVSIKNDGTKSLRGA